MKKDLGIIFGLFVIVVALLVFGRSFTSVGFVNQATGSSRVSSQNAQIRSSGVVPLSVKTLSIDATVVSKAADRKKGLSGKDSLSLNSGMLFVFESKGPYVFWMKDMKFAIDIIWIDENKRIVDIAGNVPPEPRKKDESLTKYQPHAEALYVLEINAGLAALNGLQVGDQVNFVI